MINTNGFAYENSPTDSEAVGELCLDMHKTFPDKDVLTVEEFEGIMRDVFRD